MTHHWGYVSALSAAFLFGINATLSKIVLADVHPLVVAGLIYFIAGIVLFIVHASPLCEKIFSLLETPTKTEKEISVKGFLVLGLVVLFGSVIAPFLYLYGLNATTAINASLLSNTEALFTASIAFIFWQERGRRKDYAGIVLLIIGAVFLTTNAEFQRITLTQQILGNLLIIGACLSWSLDNNLSKFLSKKRDLILVTALKCFIGGTVLLVLALVLRVDLSISLTSVPYLLSVGAFSIGFSILLFLFSLREIGAMKTGAIYSLSSLFGAIFAFLILREAFSFVQLAAGIVMLVGIYGMYKS